MNYIGNISYALHLVHLFVYVFTKYYHPHSKIDKSCDKIKILMEVITVYS